MNSPITLSGLKALRKNRGLTLDEVATGTGTVTSHIWALENGKNNNPQTKILISLADFLGCSVDELLGRNVQQENSRTLVSNEVETLLLDLTEDEKHLALSVLATISAELSARKQDNQPEPVAA